MELHSNRLTLRPSTMEDLPEMCRWVADPEAVRHVIQDVKTPEKEREWLEATLADADEILWTIVLNENLKSIGTCGLHLHPGKRDETMKSESGVSFGIMLGEKDEWGKGYGTEAAVLALEFARDVLRTPRVWLTVDTLNLRAQRSYRKAGFCFVRKQHNADRKFSRQEQYVMDVRFADDRLIAP